MRNTALVRSDNTGQSGFTLVEVILAVAIMAIALTALLGSQNQSLFIAETSRFAFVSSQLAEKKMAQILASETEPLSSRGTFGQDYPNYSWRTRLAVMTLDDLGLPARGPVKLHRIEVIVTAEVLERSFSLSRYRFMGEGW